MKRRLAVILMLTVLTIVGSRAAAPAAQPEKAAPEPGWDLFQLVFPGLPSDLNLTNVAGFKIGAPFCLSDNRVCGVEASFLGSGSQQVDGIQLSGICALTETTNGVQIAPVTVADRCNGVQIGVVNVAKEGAFQIGIVNYIEDSIVPWMIGINFCF